VEVEMPDKPPSEGNRTYRCVLHSTLAKEPFLFDIEVPNAVSAVMSVAHVAQLLYPMVTKYEVYDLAEKVPLAKVPIALAISATVKKLSEWLGIPMPLNAATIVRPKGDEAFDLAGFFKGLQKGAGGS
jgi:hypothetical protein